MKMITTSRELFKTWYLNYWNISSTDAMLPNFRTYRDAACSVDWCKKQNVDLDDFWSTKTQTAWIAFSAGLHHSNLDR